MRIILHIGMQKTGTTSLQKWFADHEKQVESLGWRCITNPFAIMRFHKIAYNPVHVKAEVDRAEAEGVEALLFSVEGISTFSAEHIRDVVDLFKGKTVEIVLCLRHWSGFLPSRWSLACAWGDVQSFPAYLSELTRLRTSHIDACYPLVIDRTLHSNPDKLSIISYNNATSQNAFLTTFLNAIGFPSTISNTETLSRANTKRDNQVVELARLFYGVVRERKQAGMNPFFESKLTGTPLKGGLTHSRLVSLIRQYNPDLIDELERRLASDIVNDWQTMMQDEILDWESSAQIAAAPYLVNPIDGRLFASREPSKESYSRIEVGMIPSDLKPNMISALEDARAEDSE